MTVSKLCIRNGVLLAAIVAQTACSRPADSTAGTGHASGQRPNLLILVTDDQRWDTLGASGNTVIQTPHLDELAEEGMLFRNAFVTTPVCAVSRASILSGQYSHRHGIRDFDAAFTPQAATGIYPVLLRAGGYNVGFIGKWGIGAKDLDNLAIAGEYFDYWAGFSHQGNYWHEKTCRWVTHNGVDEKSKNVCDCPTDGRGLTHTDIPGGNNIGDPLHLTTQIIPDKLAQFLDSRDRNRPFALSVSLKAPHGPIRHWDPRMSELYEEADVPLPAAAYPAIAAKVPKFLLHSLESDRGRAMVADHHSLQEFIRHYYRQIAGVDMVVGRIRGILASRNLARNTVILFTSDNGHLMGAHGFFGKWLMYEDSIRVPMVIYDPRIPVTDRGRVCHQMVLNIDIAPTLLDLAGMPVPKRMQGRSIVPLLTEPGLEFRQSWLFEHHFSPSGPIHIERSEGVRTFTHKYIRYIDQSPPYEELFELTIDPEEAYNLATRPEHRDTLERLRRRYGELRNARK